MSLKNNYNFTVRKRISLINDGENNQPSSKSTGVKRALFGKADTLASPKKARLSDENALSDRSSINKSPVKSASTFLKAKEVFHTDIPTKLVGRSKEISELHCFLSDHIKSKKPGSLYLSGAPGTGKTSCFMFVKNCIEVKFSFAFVNCMTVNSPAAIYKAIARELGLSPKLINSSKIAEHLKSHFSTSKSMNVVVLDEIDHLDTKDQKVLYTLFEWPNLLKSTLVFIGIANALDLTDRKLPLLNTFKFQPKLMHFLPYTKEQIVTILEDRLSEIQSDGSRLINPMALQLCARKIAANSGDIRKALDVCRRAVGKVEKKLNSTPKLQATSDDRCNPGSPMKSSQSIQRVVELQDISDVLQEVYGSPLQTPTSLSSSKSVTMPLQQTILLCTLVLMKKHCKVQDMTVGKAYDVYKRICNKRNLTAAYDFHTLCQMMQLRGFICLKPSKIPRLAKVNLKIEDGEVEHMLQDKALLPAILADNSVLYK